MTRIEMEQAVTDSLGLIQHIVAKTLAKYGAKLCDADREDIESNTVLCLLDGRLDNYVYTTAKKMEQWIGYIAMQRCVDYLRRIKKTVSFEHDPGTDKRINAEQSKSMKEMFDLTMPDEAADEALLNQEEQLRRRARLRDAVLSLPANDQHLYAAISQEGYSAQDYASKRGIKESTTYAMKHRIIKTLRERV